MMSSSSARLAAPPMASVDTRRVTLPPALRVLPATHQANSLSFRPKRHKRHPVHGVCRSEDTLRQRCSASRERAPT
jgi:hypothetical protein